jgi:hypothetical protein
VARAVGALRRLGLVDTKMAGSRREDIIGSMLEEANKLTRPLALHVLWARKSQHLIDRHVSEPPWYAMMTILVPCERATAHKYLIPNDIT